MNKKLIIAIVSIVVVVGVAAVILGLGKPAHAHSYVFAITKEATCTEEGIKTFTCQCGDTYTEAVAKINHSYTEKVTAPTCTEKGFTTFTCACGDTYQDREVAALGHDHSVVLEETAKAATCLNAGKEADKQCSRCDSVETGAELPALGHDEIHHEAKAPTCTEIGWEAYVTCSRCDYTTYEEITALGHNAVTDAAVAPTCTAAGLTEGSHCDHCGEVFTAQNTLPALEHSHVSVVTDPTCTKPGYTTYTCACGDTYAGDHVLALGHKYAEISRVEATCTENGTRQLKCETCADSYTVVLESTGHVIDQENLSGPSCTGSAVQFVQCRACGEQIELPQLSVGHTTGQLVFDTVEYCGSQQIGYINCADCGERLYTFGHNYTVETTPATCTAPGKTVHTCKNCGDAYSKEIPAIGHIYGQWRVTKESTCIVAGEEVLDCAICDGIMETRALDLKSHTYESTVSGNGITYTCSVCKHSYEEKTIGKTHQVTFITNGGTTYPSITVADGASVAAPNPEKEGYEFLGWYMDEALKNRYTGTAINQDITLYAAWKSETISGSEAVKRIFSDVGTDFTFRVKSTVRLNNSNLKKYIQVTDTSDNRMNIYIQDATDGSYTIACKDYRAAMTYLVTAAQEITILEVGGNEFWFATKGENGYSIQYKENVKLLDESYIYGIQEQESVPYMLLTQDLLNTGDVVVVYGDDRYDIIMLLDIVAEGSLGNLTVYQIEAADADDVFAEYNVYYNGELNVENIQYADSLIEEVTAMVEASPMYRQFSRAATAFAGTVGKYYYKYDGIDVKPKFKAKDSTITFDLNIVATFTRMDPNGKKTDTKFTVTLNFNNVLKYNVTAGANGFNDFSFILDVDNTAKVRLYATLATEIEEKTEEELAIFMGLLNDAKDLGSFGELDSAAAEAGEDIFIGNVPFSVYGIYVDIKLTDVVSFEAVGEWGVEVQVDTDFKVGMANTPSKGFTTIWDFETEASLSLYMMGKMEISNMIKMEVAASFIGVVEGYLSVEGGPYLEVGGMLTATSTTNGDTAIVGGGYMEMGLKLEVGAGARAEIPWLKWSWRRGLYLSTKVIFNKNWTLCSQEVPFFILGNKELPLYFTTKDEEYRIFIDCTGKQDLADIIDQNILFQSLTEMSKEEKAAECTFYLADPCDAITLTESGMVTVKDIASATFTLKLKLMYGDVYKYVTIIVTCGHDLTEWYSIADDSAQRDCEVAGCDYHEIKQIKPGEIYTQDGAYLYFGSWPQSQVTDSTLVTILNVKAGLLPSNGNSWFWTSYEYYQGNGNLGSQSNAVDYMWYQDVEYEGERYRGVYFTSYRPNHTFGTSANTSQDDNGYTTGTVYWFKWEPLKWRILTEEDGKLLLLCEMLIDSQPYQNSYKAFGENYYATDSNGNILYDDNGNWVYANNYAYSTIRTWLNSTFYQDAFTSLQKEFFRLSTVDNSTKPGDGDRSYLCGNTEDYVFLLSHMDLYNSTYGFSDLMDTLDIARQKQLTAYARIQGGTAAWWERTPALAGSDSAYVLWNGVLDNYRQVGTTSVGVCPAIWVYAPWLHHHRYTSVVTPPTKTEQGYTTHTCFCGDSYVDSYVAPRVIIAEGSCGYNLTWELDDNGLMTITGTGAMKDYDFPAYTPWYEYSEQVKNIIIGEGVTSISEWAFWRCSNMANITIPDSMTRIGRRAFGGSCGDSENGIYYVDRWVTSFDDSVTTVSLRKGTRGIADYAFENSDGLTGIDIPNSLTSIGDYAFASCSSLTSITITNGVTSIGEYAFAYCSNLMNITIPKSVSVIGELAFSGCSSLTSITVDSANQTYHSSGNCLIETSSKILIIGCKNSTIPFDGSVISISDYAFAGCSGLADITIPDSVTSIGRHAFSGCGLTSITIGNGVNSIGDYAFYDCYWLTSVIIGDNVTSIGSYAFYGCSNLTSIAISDSVTSIGESAFHQCYDLTSVLIGDSVTTIGIDAFNSCSNLTSITIPESVTSIGSSAFYGCKSLTSIHFEGTIEQWNAISKGSSWNADTGKYTIYCTDGEI